MPKTTRSIEEIEEVRERILQCAIDILVKEGYDSLSMGKLGVRVNMTAANIYNYYANKDELLIAIHKKTFAMLRDRLRKAVESGATPIDRLQNLIRGFVRFGTENVNIYDIMFNRPIRQYTDYIGTPQEELSYDEYQSSLKTLILAVMVVRDYLDTRDDLKGMDPKFITMKILSGLHGIISLYNSRILFEMDEDPAGVLEGIVADSISSITGRQ